MFSKIDLRKLLRNHWGTLLRYDKDSPRVDIGSVILFCVVPFLLSALLVWGLNISLDNEISNLIIAALSIFSGLLFGLPIILVQLKENSQNLIEKYWDEQNRKDAFRLLIDQTFFNIMYCILISIIAIVITIMVRVLPSYSFSFFICFAIYIHIILTILMILRRVYSLFLFLLKSK